MRELAVAFQLFAASLMASLVLGAGDVRAQTGDPDAAAQPRPPAVKRAAPGGDAVGGSTSMGTGSGSRISRPMRLPEEATGSIRPQQKKKTPPPARR